MTGLFWFTLQEGTRYLFVSNLNGNPIGIDVFSGSINQLGNASPLEDLTLERPINLSINNVSEANSSYQAVQENQVGFDNDGIGKHQTNNVHI